MNFDGMFILLKRSEFFCQIIPTFFMGVSKNRGNPPKMDGENNGKPYEQMDDLGVPLFYAIFGNTLIILIGIFRDVSRWNVSKLCLPSGWQKSIMEEMHLGSCGLNPSGPSSEKSSKSSITFPGPKSHFWLRVFFNRKKEKRFLDSSC